MLCVSCGKDIPINAKICPYCHRDTKASSEVQGAIILLFIAGGGVGYLFNGWIGALVGAVALGSIGGAIVFARAQSKHGDQPASVRISKQDPVAKERPDAQERRERSSAARAAAARSNPGATKPSSEGPSERPEPLGTSPSARLKQLADLKASGFLTEAEYEEKRQQIIKDL